MNVMFESLGGGLSVAVNDYCRVSEDGLLLARFAAPSPDDTACDLGTGNAVIPLYWCRRDPPAQITAVEREPAFLALARASVDRSVLNDRITLLEADWRNASAMPAEASMTLVTCNPPYFAYGASRPSPDPLRRAARQEDAPDTLPMLCRAAARLLTADGRFCLCHRPERLADTLAAVREAGLVPRRLQFVHTREGDAPWLFLLESAKNGALRVTAPLITQHRGTHTAVYRRLYR